MQRPHALILRIPLFLFPLVFFLVFIGCTKSETKDDTVHAAKSASQEPIRIAVIPKGASHEFWKSVHAGAEKAARELGISVIWKSPVKENDREGQIRVVEDFITRGVSGIVLAPADNVALRVPVRDATRDGIPVIIIDSGLNSKDPVSFVATDNYEGGRVAANQLAKLLHKKGRVAMLRYQEGQASTMNREQGFLDAIAAYPDIEVVSANQYSGPTTETSYQASENLIASLKNGNDVTVDGLFAPCEPVVFGMLRALQDARLAGTVRLVGFDSSAKLVAGLQAGHIDALVVQDPMSMGYRGVQLMHQHLTGISVPERVDTGVTLVTRKNMSDPAVHALLSPPLEDFLG